MDDCDWTECLKEEIREAHGVDELIRQLEEPESPLPDSHYGLLCRVCWGSGEMVKPGDCIVCGGRGILQWNGTD